MRAFRQVRRQRHRGRRFRHRRQCPPCRQPPCRPGRIAAKIAGTDACGAGASAHRAGSHGAAQHGTASTATACWPSDRSAASVAGADACGTGVSARHAGSRCATQHGTASTATAPRPSGRSARRAGSHPAAQRGTASTASACWPWGKIAASIAGAHAWRVKAYGRALTTVAGIKASGRGLPPYRPRRCWRLPAPSLGGCLFTGLVATGSCRHQGVKTWRLPLCRPRGYRRLLASSLGGCLFADLVATDRGRHKGGRLRGCLSAELDAVGGCRRQALEAASVQTSLLPTVAGLKASRPRLLLCRPRCCRRSPAPSLGGYLLTDLVATASCRHQGVKT